MGRRRKAAYRRKPYEERGIYRAVGRIDGASVRWGRPTLVIDGAPSTGCAEMRPTVAKTCEFDGKLSVARHAGRFFVYARANLGECGGWRHVQVTSSPDGVREWSPWSLLEFAGFRPNNDDGIYFASVRPSTFRRGPALEGQVPLLVAHMPAIIGGVGGIYRSTSSDGQHWSTPALLVRSEALPEGRTSDYPIGGALETDDAASAQSELLYVEHNVQLSHGDALSNCQGRPYICKYAYVHEPPFPPSGASATSYSFLLDDKPATTLPRAPSADGRGLPTEAIPAELDGAGCSEQRGGSQQRYAIVLRGEAYRWGCSANARRKQQSAAASYLAYAAQLERARGACVDIYAVIDERSCGGTARAALLAMYGGRLKGSVTVCNGRLKGSVTIERPMSQADSVTVCNGML